VHARFLKSVAAAVLLALTFPAAVAAEWHFTPTVGITFKADTSLLDLDQGTSKIHPDFGGSVTLLGAGILGIEGIVVWTPGLFTASGARVTKSHAVAMMGNMVLTTPRSWTEYGLRPFVSGGFGALRASWTDVIFPSSGTFPAFDIGGGAIGFLSKRTGVRFDLRYYNNVTQPEASCPIDFSFGRCHLRHMTLSAGVVIRR
jgi:hypothetical protein